MFLWLVCGFLLVNNGFSEIDARMNDSQLLDHVYLASDVKNYYRASSVLNVYNDKSAGLKTLTTMFRLSRAFSDNNVFMQSLRLSKLQDYAKYYKYRILLPLYVITLKSRLDLNQFADFARNFSMSMNLWLVYMYKSADLLRFCRQPNNNLLNVAFDTRILIKCENDPVVKEWYSVRGNEVRVNDVAMWTRSRGLILINHRSIWQRRKTLDGIRIRIATVKESALAVTELERRRGTLYGLFGSALRELADMINFTAELIATEEMYGNYCPQYGNWSGVIGRLAVGDVDIGVAEFGRSKSRLRVVDFTVPLLLTRMNLYFKEPNVTAIMWSTYMQVFDKRIWSLNIFLVIVCSFIIAIMMTQIGRKQIMSLTAENCFYIWGIQCQQGLPEFPSTSSLKLAFLSLFISSMVIYISYSATLTSYLTVFTPSLPFSTEQEFLENTSYNLTVIRGSVYHDVIQRSSDPVSEKMRERMKRDDDLPRNMHEAIHQVCNEKVVFYTNEIFVKKMRSQVPCQLMSIHTGRLDSASFTLIKRSPYRGIINFYIENFRSYGILKVLSNRHLQKEEIMDLKYLPVSFWSIVPILAIFMSGVSLAILMLICEHAAFYLTKTKKTTIARSTKVTREISVVQRSDVYHKYVNKICQ